MSTPAHWLAVPTRFAGLTRQRARWVLALLLLLVAALSIEPWRPPLPPGTPPEAAIAEDETDLALYGAIVDALRHGEDYYQVTARELRARPGYPLRPFVTFRLPLLARVQAMLSPTAVQLLLWAIAAATFAAWTLRLRALLPRRASWLIAALLLAGSMVAFTLPALVASHEVWAGLLIAWSLALWRPERVTIPVALAIAAMLIRETAALYVIVMAGFALAGRRWLEVAAWGTALAVIALVVALHAMAVWRVTGPLDTVSDGWTGLNGAWFYAMTLKHATILEMLPFLIAAPIVALALFGWCVPRDPVAARMAAVLAAYGVLIAGFARLNNFYWGLLPAPALLVGLAFVPDGLRDLARAALDRRRITVTRVTR